MTSDNFHQSQAWEHHTDIRVGLTSYKEAKAGTGAKRLGTVQRKSFIRDGNSMLPSTFDIEQLQLRVIITHIQRLFRRQVHLSSSHRFAPEARTAAMAGEDIHHEKLSWTGGVPIWPREPNIDVVRSLARRHLAAELPVSMEDNLLEVSFFTEGGFNKLYKISYNGCRTSYLLRVTIPMEPYYKTESEVATIAYLRANTSIPVPRIVAWDSNRDNELTFEWILMEKIDGVPLMDVWRKVPWEYKLELTEAIASMVKQLRDQKFDRIGGLYFKTAAIHMQNKGEKTSKPETLAKDLPLDEAADEAIHKLAVEILSELVDQVAEEFADKPIDATMDAVDGATSDIASPSAYQDLNFDTRSKADTQPRTADSQWIIKESKRDLNQLLLCDSVGNDDSPEGGAEPSAGSETELSFGIVGQAEFVVGRMFDPLFNVGNRPYLPATRGPYQSSLEWLSALVRVQLEWIKYGPIEDDEEYGEDSEEDFPMMERLCKGFLNVLPTVCSDEDTSESFCLHHTDLNAANILIHPETFEVTGIVDWEFINVVPEWRALEHPQFLQNIEPMSEDEPPVPIYEDNEDDIAVYVRDRWDERLLRRHFDQTINRISQDNRVSTDDAMRIKAKRDCREVIPALTDSWNWSKMWLKTYKTTGVSKNGQDWSKESMVYGENDSDAESETWLDELQSE